MHAFSTGRADLEEALEELVKHPGAKKTVTHGPYLTRIATNDADLLLVILEPVPGSYRSLPDREDRETK